MGRHRFGRELKIVSVRLIKERGVSVAQAARDLDVHENVLRKCVKEFSSDPVQAFPSHGHMKPEQLEIERLRRDAGVGGRLLARTSARDSLPEAAIMLTPPGRWPSWRT